MFSAVYRLLPDCPILVVSNRDEATDRATKPPQIVCSERGRPVWLGGVDGRAGGTWLGVNRSGILVAVTNRPDREVPEAARSRGLLCRDLLQCLSVEDCLAEVEHQYARHPFAGFNLLLLSPVDAAVVESGERFQIKPISAGIHTITNGPLDDPTDTRLARARDEVERLVEPERPVADLLIEAERICGLHDEGNDPAICLHGEDRGTVSSSIVALSDNLDEVEYRYAPGPPCTVAYDDYSPQLKNLLRGET